MTLMFVVLPWYFVTDGLGRNTHNTGDVNVSDALFAVIVNLDINVNCCYLITFSR